LLTLYEQRYDLHYQDSRCHAACGLGHALTRVAMSTQPSILRGTVNEYQLSGLSHNNKWW